MNIKNPSIPYHTRVFDNHNEYHYTTLWNTTCQTVHNHSNASIKRHDKLTVTDKHITTNVQSVFAFGFDTRIKTILPLINAWSMTLCWIPDHAKIVSSGTFAECLCMMRSTDLCKMPFSLAIWRVVLCVPGAAS